MKEKLKVAVLMGSTSDKAVMDKCTNWLDYFGVECEVHVMSAHRDPERVETFVTEAEDNGFGVLIAGAGIIYV